MKKMPKILLIGLGFGLVTAVLGFLTSKPAPAQAPPPSVPVTVVNTPLPTSISNPVRVSGLVSASQNGAWNVGVNNLPATQTISFNGVAQPVSFSNTALSPLFTRDVDNPARQPVLGACDLINVPGGQTQSCTINFFTESWKYRTVQ